MVIRGKEVDFKITRLKDAARFEAAKAEFEGNKDNLSGKPGEPITETIGRAIGAFRRFLITATGEDILADCDDLEEAKAAFGEFCQGVAAQKNTMPVFSAADIK